MFSNVEAIQRLQPQNLPGRFALFEDFEAASVALSAHRAKIERAALTIRDLGESVGTIQNTGDPANDAERAKARPIFVVLEALNSRLAVLFSGSPPPHAAESEARSQWGDLVARLNVDARSKLEA